MADGSHPHRRTTRLTVRVADRAASVIITAGGLTVIAAIMGIGVFLVWVAVPLFRSASAAP